MADDTPASELLGWLSRHAIVLASAMRSEACLLLGAERSEALLALPGQVC